MNSKISQSLATLFGCASLFFWAAGAVFTARLKNLPLFEILTIVFSLSFLVTAIKLSVTKQWHRIRQPLIIWVVGVVGIYGNDITYIAAFKHAPAAQADLINYLWPIFVILFSGLLPTERFKWQYLVAAAFGFAGVYILITNGQGLAGFKSEYLVGYGLALLDAVIWSGYSLLSRYYGKTPIEMIGMYCGIGALFSLANHLHLEITVIPSLSQMLILGVMGLTTQGLAYFFWDLGVKQGQLRLLSVLSYFTPVVSISLLILFGEAQFTVSLLLACLLVLIGAVVGSLNNKQTVTTS